MEKTINYYVKGLHCVSCQLLIEKKLLEFKEIKSTKVFIDKEQVIIGYCRQPFSLNKLNKIFSKNNYIFFLKPFEKRKSNFLAIAGMVILINRPGLSAFLNVNSRSSLPAFFIFGLLAGLSSCSALIGGIILSMSKTWTKTYHQLMFNSGRIIAYFLLGILLGFLGNFFKISPVFTAGLVIAVSVLMIILGLQMLGAKFLQISLPGNVTAFQGKTIPFLAGALTFFLPCGFTLSVQALALTTNNPYQSGMIMLFFALGTLPALLLIGFSTITFSTNKYFTDRFFQIAGVLVLFFALFNINSQLNVLGFSSLSNITQERTKNLAGQDQGIQIIKMQASAYAYEPNSFKVQAGIPVRWEIEDKGTSGCTNAIISQGLFDGQIDLVPGKTSVKEFTPKKPGVYKFSCWMGMISGTIEVEI